MFPCKENQFRFTKDRAVSAEGHCMDLVALQGWKFEQGGRKGVNKDELMEQDFLWTGRSGFWTALRRAVGRRAICNRDRPILFCQDLDHPKISSAVLIWPQSVPL